MPSFKVLLISTTLFLAACGSSSTTISAPMNIQFITNTDLPANFDSQGHRGARGLKPENTLPSFETALDLGVTTLELDLHYSADQVVVVWHDDKISRDKCGIESIELMISNLNLAAIKGFRCSRNPDFNRFPTQNDSPTPLANDDYHITTLEELFLFVKRYSQSSLKSQAQKNNAKTVKFNVETKRKVNKPEGINDGFDGVNPGPFELEILRLIAKYNLENRVIIQSFDKRSLNAIRTINTSIQLAVLTNGGNQNPADFANAQINIWSPNYQSLSLALVQSAHAVGVKVIPWTVNNAQSMQALIDMGVDGIITDRPDILLGLGL